MQVDLCLVIITAQCTATGRMLRETAQEEERSSSSDETAGRRGRRPPNTPRTVYLLPTPKDIYMSRSVSYGEMSREAVSSYRKYRTVIPYSAVDESHAN